MFAPLRIMLGRIVAKGDLVFTDSTGKRHHFGDGSGRRSAVRVKDRRLEWQLVIDPQMAVGKAYMDGRFIVEEGSIYDFNAMILRNIEHRPLPGWARSFDALRRMTRRIAQFNPAARAKRNAAHHYDIPSAFYDLFLDADRQYSCAYYKSDGDSLEDAQDAKKRHLAAKLKIGPDAHVLDIGSGWGGLALYLAKTTGCKVKGITLSKEQLRLSRRRAKRQGLSKAVRFELKDYRSLEGRFDRIVSVGMFEHVGINHYDEFFANVRDLMKDDGVALIHTIGRADLPGVTNPFISKYIFPGGYIPALSELMPAIERSGLYLTDVEVLRLHYAKTLRAWRQRFMANRPRAVELLGEDFCRMWEFYLAASEASFRYWQLVVFQLQLTRRLDALPLSRDYMLSAERALEQVEHVAPDRLGMAGG